MKRASVIIALALLSDCGTSYPAAASAQAADAMRGRLLFLRCSSCHDIGAAPSAKIGPNLHNVVGRKAGTLAGYSYSPAMKAAGFVWTEAKLDQWLTDPNALVPGTAMAFAGMPQAKDRQAIIAYLKKN